MTEQTNSREQLWDLIKDIKFAMFTTRHENGHLHGRPMTTQNKTLEADDALWFFMSRHSDPVDDFARDAGVNLSYADPGKDRYVSVSGTASVVDDMAKKKALWSKMNDAWFKGGVDDPDVALVKVQIIHAHYWDVKDSKVTQLFKMAKAAMGGDTPDMGESGEIRLQGSRE